MSSAGSIKMTWGRKKEEHRNYDSQTQTHTNCEVFPSFIRKKKLFPPFLFPFWPSFRTLRIVTSVCECAGVGGRCNCKSDKWQCCPTAFIRAQNGSAKAPPPPAHKSNDARRRKDDEIELEDPGWAGRVWWVSGKLLVWKTRNR